MRSKLNYLVTYETKSGISRKSKMGGLARNHYLYWGTFKLILFYILFVPLDALNLNFIITKKPIVINQVFAVQEFIQK